MCEKATGKYLYTRRFVPDHLKTQEMCERAMCNNLCMVRYVPDHLKTQETCEIAIEKDPYILKCVPDWIGTQQQIKIWYDDDYYSNNNEIIEWYEGHQKRKAQKAKTMPIAWHPSMLWDWCVPEDEKKERGKLFLTI